MPPSDFGALKNVRYITKQNHVVQAKVIPTLHCIIAVSVKKKTIFGRKTCPVKIISQNGGY